jgi:ATP-binding cassette subfamily F protein uup
VLNYLKETAELVKTADGQIITAAQMLERFLFPPDQQYAPINKLSGGERRRLFLLKVLLEAPNVLILDEPTNDVDVQTLSVLEEYLEEFNGCVIVVSHDRYFLDRTVEKVFAFERNGNLRQYPGNYSVYLDLRSAEEPIDQPEKAPAPQSVATDEPATTNRNGRSRKLSYKEKRELEHLETHLPQWETEKAALEKRLYENPPSGYSEVEKLSQELADLSHQIDQGTERWLELSELAEV